jgi:hypothetical protein
MFQEIGNHLDTLLFLVIGIVCLTSAPRAAAKAKTVEDAAKQKRLLRIAGTLLLVGGIGRLLV